MMTPSLAMPLFALAVSLAVLVVGGVMVRRGAVGRRVGGDPHCRACGYALIGITADRCPECGADLHSPRAVARGRPERRPWLTAAGGLVLAAGAGLSALFAGVAYRAVDWYRLKPTAWVLADFNSANDAVRAALELRGRFRDGRLSVEDRNRLAEKALAAQVAFPSGPAASELVDLLGEMAVAGKLPPEQRERFFRQIVTAELEVRPKVLPGDPVPYRLRFRSNSPGAGWFSSLRLVSIAVDGKPAFHADGRSGFSGLGSAGAFQSAVRCDGPGRHTVTATARVRVMQGPRAVADVDDPAARPVYEAELVRTAETVVLDRHEPTVRRVRDPALAEPVRAGLLARAFRADPDPGGVSGEVSVTAAPANLAFDVLVRAGGREHRLGTMTAPRGGTSTHLFHGMPLDLPPGATEVDLVFRPSDRAAMNTVDLFEIWDGEVLIERVPVTRRASSPSPGG